MRNLKVFISYNGADYHGFQRQDNAVSVQEVVEKAIGKLLKIPPPVIYGCSRTDAGVHARRFCFNVHVDSRIPCEGFVKGMNTLLPYSIAVLSCEDVPEDFHARFCTKAKEYVYLINNKPNRDVFMQKLAYHYPYKLDISAMNRAAELFIGEHDFAGFCRAEGKARVKSTVRTIYDLNISQKNGICEIKIRGNGFLYNMVRIVAGTLIYVSEGRRSLDDIRRALNSGERDFAGVTLPADGLYLNEVFYEESERLSAAGQLSERMKKLHTTGLGAQRIRRNLVLPDCEDVVEWCKNKLRGENASVTRRGKNFYVIADGCEITVNAESNTIITAHRV
ncbi:MAG: tRNA pseudouridine(38-40) synthase TruA [Oscillospiraceae bacterium]|nr:tRNA pseudouridine(38-40) synthase TruA [Oscillospiraceae bacterium]